MKNLYGSTDGNLNADLINFLEPLVERMSATGATILFLSDYDKILKGYRFDKNNFYNPLEKLQPEKLKPEDVNVKILSSNMDLDNSPLVLGLIRENKIVNSQIANNF